MIKKLLFFSGCVCFVFGLNAQTIEQKLKKAYQQFESDSQMRHAISSLYVINAKTGEVVFDKNSQIGLAPASTLKIITASTAFELLGKDYRYKTEFSIKETSKEVNDIYVKSFGDPTFGSWRYNNTKPDTILKNFYQQLTSDGYQGKAGQFVIDNLNFETKTIPGGWIWDDVGNYYGAGAGALIWKENQYDLALRSADKIGDPVKIVSVNGKKDFVGSFTSEARSAAPGTGDNAYVYLPLGDNTYTVRGTIPVSQDSFIISGAVHDGVSYFTQNLGESLRSHQKISPKENSLYLYQIQKIPASQKVLYTHYSPTLDSIIYWFLKRSINLYGEALVKTFAFEKNGYGSTDSGVAIVKNFWKQKGLDPDELNISDGSGLSPQNRVTTHAQVEILKYAKQQSWFPYFYDALPEFNNMKMKSGSISDVKGYCGYHTSGDGTEYIFSFLVNNYNGRASTVVNKMFKVLDALK
jgi:D-alanyl-D-alanine carboxypeptidase/D-alanyl-D-alanine-endopeptidase (penicillin-binding protein 4)